MGISWRALLARRGEGGCTLGTVERWGGGSSTVVMRQAGRTRGFERPLLAAAQRLAQQRLVRPWAGAGSGWMERGGWGTWGTGGDVRWV